MNEAEIHKLKIEDGKNKSQERLRQSVKASKRDVRNQIGLALSLWYAMNGSESVTVKVNEVDCVTLKIYIPFGKVALFCKCFLRLICKQGDMQRLRVCLRPFDPFEMFPDMKENSTVGFILLRKRACKFSLASSCDRADRIGR